MKKCVSLLLSLLICMSVFSPITVFASTTPTMTVGTAHGYAGETVTVEIFLQNNPGIAALQLLIGYDNTKLQLMNAEDHGLLGANSASFGNLRRIPYSLTWDDSGASSDHIEDGVLAVLTFLIFDTAEPGDTEITLSVVQGGTFNLDLDDVVFQTVNGTVTVQSDSVSTAIITVGNVSGKSGDDVDVPITVEDNPGLIAMLLSLNYDTDKIKLTGVTDGTVFGTGNALFGKDYTQVPYKLLWENGTAQSNYSQSGTLATLHFHILDSAAIGSVSIALQYAQDSTFDMDFNEIPLELHDGQVTIEQSDEPPVQPPLICIEGGQTITAGDTITLPVAVQNNPGMVAAAFSVNYDSGKLELIRADAATDVFPSGTATMSNDLSLCPFNILFEDGGTHTNYVGDGTLVLLTFHAKQDAEPGETQISLALDSESTFNVDLTEIAFQTEDALITINASSMPFSPCIFSDSAVAREGSEFTLPVRIRNNPGVVALLVKVTYDPLVLTWIGAEFDNSTFPEEYGTYTNDYSQAPFYLLWEQGDATAANNSNGIFANLRFRVKQNVSIAETSVQFEVIQDSTLNIDLQEVIIETESATVQIDTPMLTCDKSILRIGQTAQMRYAYRLGSPVPEGVVWSSENETIATVSESGVVTALQIGTTNIVAIDTYGNVVKFPITVMTDQNSLRIFSFDGDFEQQIDWWKKYSSATMTLGFLIYGCDDAVRYVWSTNSWRVDIDQQGHITNSGPFARSAKIWLRAYDRDDNVVAETTVTVRFYKFNWQYRRLQSQEIVSDNMFRPTVEPTTMEPETLVSFVTAFFTKVFWLFIR